MLYLVQHKTACMEQGWDPDVRRHFLKILNSLTYGLIWLIASATAGIYYGLAGSQGKPFIYTIFFYTGMLISLGLLVRYYYRTWKK